MTWTVALLILLYLMFICQNCVFISAVLQARYLHHTSLTRADAINGFRPHERFTKKPIRAALLFYPPYRELCVHPSGPVGRSLFWLPFLRDTPSCVEKSIVVHSGTANSSFRTSGSSGQETSGSHSIISPTPSPKIFMNSSFGSSCFFSERWR
jgi:hypothetical protein